MLWVKILAVKPKLTQDHQVNSRSFNVSPNFNNQTDMLDFFVRRLSINNYVAYLYIILMHSVITIVTQNLLNIFRMLNHDSTARKHHAVTVIFS